MRLLGRQAVLVMILGDISILYLSVWITLELRFFGSPDPVLILAHLTSFSFLFIAWLSVYALSGLYGSYSLVFKRKLPEVIFTAQAFNVVIAALVFFLIPFFQITPKTILVLYLIVSTVLMYLWRVYMYPHIILNKKVGAIILGSGVEIAELAEYINKDRNSPLTIRAIIRPELTTTGDIERTINLLTKSGAVCVVVADVHNQALRPSLAFLQTTTYVKKQSDFIDARELYQEVFERVPLSLIDERWILEHISLMPHRVYTIAKRIVDIFLGGFIMIVFIVVLPFVALAIKWEDGGSIFIRQKRIGKSTIPCTLLKFRSMAHADKGAWIGENGENYVTHVGSFLRRSHIDELPQVLNIIIGNVSLVGPRPDIAGIYEDIHKNIPFYELRYSIIPGLTGWAQTTQVYENGGSPQSLLETQTRLAYDLYYVKNRSLLLDFKIIIRTFGTLVTTLFSVKPSMKKTIGKK